ncbi:MAG: hypothetical protein KDA65_07960 [Planctomycetaceae bacterium]|nr:hypothetical protein [Planctomycetaceae bacterium]
MISYRTRDGEEDYRFSIERQPDGTLRIYIASQPSYNSRSEAGHITHRLTDGDRKYICWDSPIRSKEDAKRIIALWADSTQSYRKTGRTF